MSNGRRRSALLLAMWVAGCAAPTTQPPADKDDANSLLWPPPPERPRFAWDASLRSAADLFVDTEDSRLQRFMTGAVIPRDPAFEKPAAVAALNGRIYVADSVQRRIVVFDVPRRKVFVMGLRQPGTLQKPNSIAIDKEGAVYVVDTSLRKVLVYDSLGLYLRTIGTPAELERPTGVAVESSGERIYVIDRGDAEGERHRVLAYDAEGKLLMEIGKRGSGPGEFNIPVQGTVTPDGTLWVLDAGNFRVQAFDREGRYLRSFGEVGSSLGQFARPRGIASDLQGRLYVTDAAFCNVQVFTPAGELLISVGRTGRTDGPGVLALPLGTGVDETGRIYVVDQYFRKVEVFRPIGEKEAQQLMAAAERRRQSASSR